MKRLILPALLVSLTFNLLAVVGFVHAKRIQRQLTTPEGRVELLGRRLGVTPDQLARSLAIEGERQAAMAPLRERLRPQGEAFWAQVVADAPDRAELKRLTDETRDGRAELEALEIEYLLQFMAVLTPAERARCARMIRQKNPFAD